MSSQCLFVSLLCLVIPSLYPNLPSLSPIMPPLCLSHYSVLWCHQTCNCSLILFFMPHCGPLCHKFAQFGYFVPNYAIIVAWFSFSLIWSSHFQTLPLLWPTVLPLGNSTVTVPYWDITVPLCVIAVFYGFYTMVHCYHCILLCHHCLLFCYYTVFGVTTFTIMPWFWLHCAVLRQHCAYCANTMPLRVITVYYYAITMLPVTELQVTISAIMYHWVWQWCCHFALLCYSCSIFYSYCALLCHHCTLFSIPVLS